MFGTPRSAASAAATIRSRRARAVAANQSRGRAVSGVRPSAKVRDLYAVRKGEALRLLDDLLARGSFATDELEVVAGALHKLAGTAAMFGEAALGDRARILEDGTFSMRPDTADGHCTPAQLLRIAEVAVK